MCRSPAIAMSRWPTSNRSPSANRMHTPSSAATPSCCATVGRCLSQQAVLEMPCGVFQPRQVHTSYCCLDGRGVFCGLHAGRRPHGPVVGQIRTLGVELGHHVRGIPAQRRRGSLGKHRQMLQSVRQRAFAQPRPYPFTPWTVLGFQLLQTLPRFDRLHRADLHQRRPQHVFHRVVFIRPRLFLEDQRSPRLGAAQKVGYAGIQRRRLGEPLPRAVPDVLALPELLAAADFTVGLRVEAIVLPAAVTECRPLSFVPLFAGSVRITQPQQQLARRVADHQSVEVFGFQTLHVKPSHRRHGQL